MSLHERCRKVLNKIERDAMLRQNDPISTLIEFVVAEQGRSADRKLEETLPLCLYFTTSTDREEFVQAMREIHPEMMMKEV